MCIRDRVITLPLAKVHQDQVGHIKIIIEKVALMLKIFNSTFLEACKADYPRNVCERMTRCVYASSAAGSVTMAVSCNAPAIIGCLSDTSIGEISFSLAPRRQLTSSRRYRVGGFQVAVSFVCLSLYGCEQTDGHCQPDVGRLIVWQYVLQMSPQYGELRPTNG